LLDALLDDFVASRDARRRSWLEVMASARRHRRHRRRGADVAAGLIRAGQRRSFEARLADLKQPADPGRVEQELVLWLQKLDVDEEIDRLDSHLSELRRTD
jgi:uncharacterized protein YicC (UPF0701 family)